MAGTGRRLTSTTAREAARKRWAKRVAIASPAPQGGASQVQFEDAALEREIAQGIRADQQQRAYELELQRRAKLAAIPESPEGDPAGGSVVGSREFSPGNSGAQLAGSPTVDDRPAGDAPVPAQSPTPQPVPVAVAVPAKPAGPTWRCAGCGIWVRGWAAMSAHRCGLQPPHAAHAWTDR